VGLIMTLPAEATGSAPGRGRLTGRRVLVVGAGTRPSPEPDPPVGNGRAISVLAAREGAAVACADRDADAAEVTAALVHGEGQIAAVVLADVALPEACASMVAESAAALGGLDGLVLNGPGNPGQPRGAQPGDTPLGREASRRNPGRTARSLPFGRQATAWEVAYATAWLLSGESSYVNAHPLVLDGGAASFG
jgi:NAD(P)-dependent dehydrogenase (short-subunit alcohol dehydrogenase family)